MDFRFVFSCWTKTLLWYWLKIPGNLYFSLIKVLINVSLCTLNEQTQNPWNSSFERDFIHEIYSYFIKLRTWQFMESRKKLWTNQLQSTHVILMHVHDCLPLKSWYFLLSFDFFSPYYLWSLTNTFYMFNASFGFSLNYMISLFVSFGRSSWSC